MNLILIIIIIKNTVMQMNYEIKTPKSKASFPSLTEHYFNDLKIQLKQSMEKEEEFSYSYSILQ